MFFEDEDLAVTLAVEHILECLAAPGDGHTLVGKFPNFVHPDRDITNPVAFSQADIHRLFPTRCNRYLIAELPTIGASYPYVNGSGSAYLVVGTPP